MSKYEKIVTPEFRVSFPNVFEAKAFGDQEPKYSVVMLFDKKTDISALKKLAQKAIEAKWPDATKRPKGLKNPFRDGDGEDKNHMSGYPGHIFITASSKQRPGLVMQGSLAPITDKEEFYAGCYARASVTCYAYDTKGNRGVAFGLQNIMKTKEGEKFSGKAKAEDDFSEFGGDMPAGGKAEIEETEDLFA